MAGAIHDHNLSPLRTNILGGRIDSITILVNGATVQTANLAPGYAVERTGAGEYTITVPRAQFHTVVASSDADDQILVEKVANTDNQVTVTLAGGDPAGISILTLFIASGDHS